DRSRLRNFVKKFIRTVRFGNDHFGAIMRQFCDSDLKVAFRKHPCYVRDTDVVELIKGSCGSNLYTISVEDMMKSSPICLLSKASKTKSWLWHRRFNHLNFGTINDLARKNLFKLKHFHTDNGTEFVNYDLTHYYESVGIFHQKSVPKTPQQNGVVERRNRTLVEAARTMLIFSKALMFLWAEAVATACYTQNRSLIHTHHNKTPYELVHNKKPYLTFLRIFGALCYPTNDNEDLGKLQPTVDIGIFVGYAPSRKELEILFQPMFDEYMEPPHIERPVSHAPTVPVPVLRVAESTHMDENPFAPVDNDPFINIFALEPNSEASASGDASSAESTYISSGLVPNLVPVVPYVPPNNKELEILFQPMFDEYMEPPHIERPVSHAPAVPVPVQSNQPTRVAESTHMDENPFAPVNNDPFINIFALEPNSKASSSGDASSAESTYVT
nr:integrase, catalytic region, zinc finger, CCHC-type, peptidase aspartic, catalytic [Tanacetum cinerariifolium]